MDCQFHLAQLEPTLGNLDANLAMHADAAERSAAAGADCVLFSELSLTGYFLKDQTSEVALRRGEGPLERIAELSKEISIAAGFVERGEESKEESTIVTDTFPVSKEIDLEKEYDVEVIKKSLLDNYPQYFEGIDASEITCIDVRDLSDAANDPELKNHIGAKASLIYGGGTRAGQRREVRIEKHFGGLTMPPKVCPSLETLDIP